MELAHLHQLSKLEQTYWWHRAKRALVSRWLTETTPAPGLVIEGGIGSAGNLLAFQKLGYDVAGLDIMPEAVDYGRQLGLDRVAVHDLEQDWPFEPESAAAVVLLDVIEHVEHPIHVLAHARRCLRPGGAVIVTVPAYQWLYGDWDKALGHYRRYSRSMLKRQAAEAGLEVQRVTHWNSFTLPAAMGIRTWQKLRPAARSAEFPEVSGLVNRLLLGCAAAERSLSQHVPIPCGLSIAALLTKASR